MNYEGEESQKSKTGFVVRDDILYYVYTHKDKVEEIEVGPGIRFLYILYNDDEKKRQVVVKFDKYEYTDIDFSREKLEKITRIPVLNEKLMRKYIMQEMKRLRQEKQYKYLMARTGWLNDDSDIFCIPGLQDENIFYNHPEVRRFVIRGKEKQHELVLHALSNANELGVLYVCAVAAVFLRDLGSRGFSVLVTGPAGIGKTTLCKLACNLFYDYSYEVDLNVTKVAKERILLAFKDLPFLLNEAALTKDEFLEELLFWIESGQTRKRSNVNLTYNFSQIRNVVFITSEREIRLSRLGAERRKIHINLHEKIKLPVDVKDALKFVGAGLDYVKFYIENKSEVLSLREEIESNFELTQYYQLPVVFSLCFLEKFYRIEFSLLKERILELFNEQVTGSNFEDYYVNKFTNYIAANISKFYCPELNFRFDKDGNQIPNNPAVFYGFIELNRGSWHIFLTTDAFNRFCEEYAIDKKTFLTILEKQGMLVYNESTRKTYKVKPGRFPLKVPVYRYYYIKMDSSLFNIPKQDNMSGSEEKDLPDPGEEDLLV